MEGPQGVSKSLDSPKGPSVTYFTSDWFTHHIPNWNKWLAHLTNNKESYCVEIGSWEGRSALWIAENILKFSTKSRLFCVDTWLGSEEPAHRLTKLGVYERFAKNLHPYLQCGKVVTLRGSSDKALPTLYNIILQGKISELDFAYVDGSHMAADVLSDIIFCFHMLKVGGIMIIDDYEWNVFADCRKTPKIAIDSFMTCFCGRIDIIYKGPQVVIRKTHISQELNDAK